MVTAEDGVLEWYAGKTLFITGATGFMGKVLIEKLLRSIPDLKRIYILCRPKKGFSPATRVAEITKLPVFDKLRQDRSEVFKKLVALEGDLVQKNLGLSERDREILINEVNIVINGAASLRLEAGIKSAVEHNTVGTKRVLDLACEMKHLLAFVHLSTAFCHCEYDVLDELVYPSQYNPSDVMQAIQWMDDNTLEAITPKLLGPHPNCYTFSKRLSESLVNEYANRIPVAIARPSIVTPAMIEPVPGWVDSLNGPVGVIVAGAKGLIRSMMVGENFHAQVVPVDIAINAIIIIARERALIPCKEDVPIPVYNLTTGDVVKMTWGEVLEKGRKLNMEYPFEAGLWYPKGTIRMNPVTHYLIVLFCQILPAYFIDALLYIIGQKTFLVRVQKRISVGMQVLQYFTTRKWDFKIDNAVNLPKKLNKRDQEIFYTSNVNPDVDKYLLDVFLGARQFCMKEPLSTLDKARYQLKMMYWLDVFFQIFLYSFLIWLFSDVLYLSKVYNTFLSAVGKT